MRSKVFTVERTTLAVALLTLLLAFFQLRSANRALDANNAFIVESELLNLGLSALEAVENSNASSEPSPAIKNSIRRYEASLVAASTLEDNGGLRRGTWNDIMGTQCAIFAGNFDLLPDLNEECKKR
jgi:hypothetical protein